MAGGFVERCCTSEVDHVRPMRLLRCRTKSVRLGKTRADRL